MSEEELKTLNVKRKNWEKLYEIRLKNKSLKTLDDVISFLLKNQK